MQEQDPENYYFITVFFWKNKRTNKKFRFISKREGIVF